MECPFCGSHRVQMRQVGKKVGCAVGGIAGVISGSSAALSAGELGTCIGAIGGPPGMALGGIAGAILGGLAGAAIGCAAGEEAGAVLDGRLLDTHVCEECGRTFNR